MKKTQIISIMFVSFMLMAISSNAQPSNRPVDPMSVGDWTLSLGIGSGASNYSGAGSGPGFQVAVEKGMWKLGPGTLTLGGQIGFSYFVRNNPSWKHSWFSSIFAARSAYHYGWNVRGLDTYAGFALGFRFVAFSETYKNGYPDNYNNPAAFGPHFGGFAGASYFFNPKVGLNAELGYNINFAQIGVIFKLN